MLNGRLASVFTQLTQASDCSGGIQLFNKGDAKKRVGGVVEQWRMEEVGAMKCSIFAITIRHASNS
jgi:hypothetical protein